MLGNFFKEEAGFVISTELVLVGTIVVMGLIVGLTEIQHAIVTELNDISEATGEMNQGYMYSGFSKEKQANRGYSSYTRGAIQVDSTDDCDNDQCDIACDVPLLEATKTL